MQIGNRVRGNRANFRGNKYPAGVHEYLGDLSFSGRSGYRPDQFPTFHSLKASKSRGYVDRIPKVGGILRKG